MIKIKIVGIGGAGGNTVSRIKRANFKNVQLIAINTDYQDLKKAKADLKIRIGKTKTQGMGTGMNPELGKAAAKENISEIKEILKDTDLLFLTFGGGGGTGSGAAPVIAEVAKRLNILTIAVVSLPFYFEGETRMAIAKEGIKKLKDKVDTLILIQNDRLLKILNPKTSLIEAFELCDEILKEAVFSIINVIHFSGTIKISFAQIKNVLKNAGTAIFSSAKAFGKERTEILIKRALSFPLLDINPKGAKAILFNLAGEDLSLEEIKRVGERLLQEINPKAKIFFGTVQEPSLKEGEIKLTLIAAGFPFQFD